jgi:subtilisin family serine protease
LRFLLICFDTHGPQNPEAGMNQHIPRKYSRAAIPCAAAAVAIVLGLVAGGKLPSASAQTASTAQLYVVAFQQTGSLPSKVDSMVSAAGGTIVAKAPEIGGIAVVSSNSNFATAMLATTGVKAVDLSSSTTLIDPMTVDNGVVADSSTSNGGTFSPAGPDPQPMPDPLGNQQWDKMRMNATLSGSYAVQRGRRDVTVAILDTGTDTSHPDIAPNFDATRSRSFVPTEPTVQDMNGHGTWCMSAVGAPINGIGVSGVAPNVNLVSLKVLNGAGSGAFFWLDLALIYAGVNHFDVASMSLGGFIPKQGDKSNSKTNGPGDHTDYILLQRSVEFARSNGVLPVAALGNNNFDLSDGNFFRSFIEAPGEIAGVVGVAATGYYNQKSFYSNYGMGKSDVSAPGGSTRNYTGVPGSGAPPPPYFGLGRVLGAWSHTGQATGFPDPNLGVEQCTGPGGTPPCYEYAWVQGTSMATPNTAGVAALIISQYGDFTTTNQNKAHMSPTSVESILQITANNQPCPDPSTVVAGPGINPPTATCQGSTGFDNFFGKGIVDALKAVTFKK